MMVTIPPRMVDTPTSSYQPSTEGPHCRPFRLVTDSGRVQYVGVVGIEVAGLPTRTGSDGKTYPNRWSHTTASTTARHHWTEFGTRALICVINRLRAITVSSAHVGQLAETTKRADFGRAIDGRLIGL